MVNAVNDSVNIGRLSECIEAVDGIPGPPIGELALEDFDLDIQMVIRIGPKNAKISERASDLVGLGVIASRQIVDQPPMIPTTIFKGDPL